ncbi:DUF11 domain-containing protein [Candidatus Saccharibacteria bacterium]|nr:DUF11 domain-containing protein [Candidatus Saccharibacteria bacterium]
MKHLKISNKTLGFIAGTIVMALAMIISVAAFAWGPDRTTYTIEKPANKVTFNSMTDNPNYGDERNFLIAKGANESTSSWRDVVNVSQDGEYTVRLYVHNNAAANLNLVAKDTKAQISLPNTWANSIDVNGYLSASNATPAQIWDQVTFKGTSTRIHIAYITGSARYFNNVNPSTGFVIPDSVVSSGALIGYEKMDGNVPGCYQYSGILTIRVKVTTEKDPGFTVEKKVRLHGSTDWVKIVNAKPGEQVDYQIGYKNTGTAQQNNVIAKDQLPIGVTYKNSTTTLRNAANPDGNGLRVASNNLITTKGINIGNYAAGANAYVRFTATLPAAKDLRCGKNTLTNTGSIETDNGAKSDTANVVIDVECAPNECKPGVPEGDARCDEALAAPVAPDELPHTGPAEIVLSIVAVLAITVGVIYWYRSNEAVKKVTVGGKLDNFEATVKHSIKTIKSKFIKK